MNDSPRVLGNRYEVGALLGRGGMAEVHLGRDARLGRTVAIKLLRTDLARDPTFQARFRREAQSAAALNHPAIVAVYDTGEEQVVESGGGVVSLPYIVMEHIEGRTLRDVLAEGHHLDVDAALDIITGVLTALEYSHRIGIVHRDIKPANVMLTPVGDVKVMDFGIARAMADASSTMTQTQAVIGTAQYLSPEQARGEQVDTRSDLYSAGCLLYELLTGRPPFTADSPVAVAYQHVREQPVPPSRIVAGIPESVDRIVLHSLAKGRDERYQTAADFRADVEAARGGRQVYAVVPPVQNNAQNAATQFIPPANDLTGTRMAPAASGPPPGQYATNQYAANQYGQYGADTAGGGQAAFDQFGQNNDYNRRQPEPQKSNVGLILAGIALVVILALVGYLVASNLNKKDDDTGGTGGAAATVAVPKVTGETLEQATADLKAKGFTNVTSTKAADADVDKGKVSNQDPAADQAVATSTQITLTVSTGPDSQSVPDETGKSVDDAKADLADHGFTSTSVKYKDDASQKQGDVISTSPASGKKATPDTLITITAASDSIAVPAGLLTMSQEDAEAALEKAVLKANVTLVVAPDEDPGSVIDVKPGSGKKVKRGSTVNLTVAQAGTTTPTTPPATTSAAPTPTPTGTDGDG